MHILADTFACKRQPKIRFHYTTNILNGIFKRYIVQQPSLTTLEIL